MFEFELAQLHALEVLHVGFNPCKAVLVHAGERRVVRFADLAGEQAVVEAELDRGTDVGLRAGVSFLFLHTN